MLFAFLICIFLFNIIDWYLIIAIYFFMAMLNLLHLAVYIFERLFSFHNWCMSYKKIVSRPFPFLKFFYIWRLVIAVVTFWCVIVRHLFLIQYPEVAVHRNCVLSWVTIYFISEATRDLTQASKKNSVRMSHLNWKYRTTFGVQFLRRRHLMS